VERRVLVAAWLGVAVGCAGVERVASPVAPVDRPVLTVRVHERNTEIPIRGALVQYGTQLFYTDGLGESAVSVDASREATITVSAAGYREMSASGFLSKDERWTFYLAAEADQ
jgi:hypothetical protein